MTAAADGWTDPSNLVIGDRGMYLNRFAGWWMGPPGNPPRPPRWGDKYAAKGARAFALLLGLLANLTVIGSLAPSGIVLCKCLMALSASIRWSNRTNPTPFERPEEVVAGHWTSFIFSFWPSMDDEEERGTNHDSWWTRKHGMKENKKYMNQ